MRYHIDYALDPAEHIMSALLWQDQTRPKEN